MSEVGRRLCRMGNTSTTAGELKGSLTRIVTETALIVGGLEPRDLPASQVPGLLDVFIALEKKAASGRILLAARAAESDRWKREGFSSQAEWLAAKQGTTTGRARRRSGHLGPVGRVGRVG